MSLNFSTPTISKTKNTGFYAPKLNEFTKESEKKLHSIWLKNHHILLGIIESQKNIPEIGFHGTDLKGRVGILESKNSGQNGGDIFITALDACLDSITYLADLYTLIEKANNYSTDDGALFVLNAQNSRTYGKYIYYSRSFMKLTKNDSMQAKNFLSLIYRNRSKDRHISLSTQLECVSTSQFHVAVEKSLKFDQTNYKERVMGIIDKGPYTSKNVNTLYHRLKSYSPFELFNRFRQQYFLFQTLKLLNIIKHSQVKKWNKFEKIGINLMSTIDKVTQISCKKLLELNKNISFF